MSNKMIWFLCNTCYKYNSLPATKEQLDYYDGMDCSYCPNCDDEEPCDIAVGYKPPKPFGYKLFI